ncbi:MAG: PDDEXK nuclease domain-containing protein [Lentisphaeria bacterium]|nr:PDDEXK nuclease domain-containing protein [Lentisphaeria bacterium]
MKPTKSNPTLSERVITLIEEARRKVAVSANIALVYTYYEIGRMIVEEEQGGKARAEYGRRILDELSSRLTERFGKGWSVPNLKLIRQFFITYSNSLNTVYPIGTLETQSNNISTEKIVHGADDFCLSWSHYLVLMRIANSAERQFYEHEAAEGQWSIRQLSRQIGSQLYERMQKHKDTCSVQELMSKAPRPEVAIEPLKDPYTLEFLGLPEKTDYSETQLEQAIIDHLAEFMLELGKGFTFVGRQVRFTFEEEHYKVDLVFYNRLTRSFFVFNLKLSKITHQDLGQMQMYVHYYDRIVKLPDENPTIGILLSSEEVNDATVKMTLPECEHNRIFARQYKTVLPSEDTFKRIIQQQRIAFENKVLTSKAERKNE